MPMKSCIRSPGFSILGINRAVVYFFSGTHLSFLCLAGSCKTNRMGCNDILKYALIFSKVEWSRKKGERSQNNVIDGISKMFPNLLCCLALYRWFTSAKSNQMCQSARQHPRLCTLITSKEIKCRLEKSVMNEVPPGEEEQ